MKLSVLLLALAFAAPAAADTLLIQRAQATQGKTLPTRGQTMTQVEATFGAPQQKHAAVGGGSEQTPPITRWDYAEFSVYFENDRTLNAVLKHSHANELGPKPAK
ncbi:MAG TPA: hypothetical protein VFY12_14060 [Arenimonas sp.]|nr:hypothetical protein [Arenimonas sp.]